MIRSILAVVSLGYAPVALAVDIGTTYGLPVFDLSGLEGNRGNSLGTTGLPTLDLIFGDLRLRIDALDTIDQLVSDPTTAYVGADLFYVPVHEDLAGSWQAVFGVGGSLGIVLDPSLMEIGAIAPMGLEIGDDAHVGLYIQPFLGVFSAGGNTSVGASASFVGSLWY